MKKSQLQSISVAETYVANNKKYNDMQLIIDAK